MLENLKKFYQEETLAERSQRMIPAAIYGALIGAVYVLTLSVVNVWTLPNLPLGVDWARLLGMWIGFSVAFALFGAVAACSQRNMRIVGGELSTNEEHLMTDRHRVSSLVWRG